MAERDPAEARLWIMTLVRLGGLAVTILGLWLSGTSDGRTGWILGGLALMSAGALIVLFAPRALNRHWNGRR